ncbi:hypothetical protein [Notoacmeibacter sp. MSK16QG-6]|uniref:hypothetical protein n=1 Tax=Notoacmeibacter sp. MSK16QG-6 TaxID=2957982 RepID=UPI0020A02826|nr:hypothetical protein [Notoacmeibacter sp. MSK16QG-6]MCP1200517.1 hypothetical protein [Notoacmeibacter sp. MSK16QG-6]
MISDRLGVLIRGAALALAFSSVVAQAHPVPETAVILHRAADLVAAEVSIPVSELALVVPLGRPVNAQTIKERYDEIRAYLQAHTRASSADGIVWRAEVTRLELGKSDGPHGRYAVLNAQIALSPPNGMVTPFTLNYDAVMERVVTHRTEVFLVDSHNQPQRIGIIAPDPQTLRTAPLNVPTE